jgi:hypothetical protein
MRKTGLNAANWLVLLAAVSIAVCGCGGVSLPPAQPAKTTPAVVLTLSAPSITSAQGLTVTVNVNGASAVATGSVTLSSGNYSSAPATLVNGSAAINVPAGSLAPGTDSLTVAYTPDAASSSTYTAASGSGSVTVNALTSPVVSVNPSLSSITTVQALTVAVGVSGSGSTPTGSVTLTSGGYTSGPVVLASGSASFNVPAGSLTVGTDSLTVNYTPDAASSPYYKSATGTGSVTVNALTTPAVTVNPSVSSITTLQALTVTVGVSGSGATPTGSVTLTSGSYNSGSSTLSSGGASFNVPAGSLAVGTDSLTVTYTPDAASSIYYQNATGTGSVTVTPAATYSLTVASVAPSSGVSISVSPSDNNGASTGSTPFTRTYNAGTQVTLSAPLQDGSYSFVSWSGCTPVPTIPGRCILTVNSNMAATATYNETQVLSITVTPTTATIGAQQQFTATVNGTGNYTTGVTWSVSAPGSSLSPGDISSSGLYSTPYPAPATVTVTATSTMSGFTNVSGSAVVTLSQPPTATGPALNVDAGNKTHAISPLIYGMDAYLLHGVAADAAAVAKANITVDRWGGDSTERYNYQLDVTSDIADWYFENGTGNAGDGWPAVSGVKAFDALVESNNSSGIKTLGTVPVLGWVAKDSTSCSYPKSTYPSQYAFDPYSGLCGDGETPSQANITGNSPTVTSISEPPPTPPAASAVNAAWADATWTGGWVQYLVNKFGPGNPAAGTGTGVSIYDVDNEPSWWDAGSRDVHPLPFTYDEVTNGDIGTALAIKTVDPTAYVSGPVMDYWWDYFYSKKDVEQGWSSGAPCYQPWSNPTDRAAHGGVPFIQYYLSQFAQAQTTYGKRLLDYLDLHTYFAAQYPAGSGNGVAFTTAGDTQEQAARLNSTRAFWDATYTDSSNSYPQPNYSANPSSLSCTVPQQAPNLIPMMKSWVNDPTYGYPGTKLAIDEYNWGGMESINGAVAQADILGIFGREGLDLGTLWPSTNPSQQIPGMMAFAIYRNYDGNNSTFGDTALASTSKNSSSADGEGQLAVYGAERSSDNAITIMVINKTYGSLTSTISIANFTAASGTMAQVYQYSNANLNSILTQPSVAVTPPGNGSTTSTISETFPAQSMTLLVVPN